MEAMYQFLREQSKKNANIKPVDFSQLFQGKTAYEVLQSVVQGYVNMNHQEKLLTFYKVIYSERSIQPMAARIVAEETERMIIATKQLFYAMEIHKLLHFENADMSALSFAMTVHGLMDYEMDYLSERRFCKKITVSVHCTIVTVYRKCSGVWKSSTIDIRSAFCTMSYTDKLYECNIKNKRNT